MKYRLHSTVIAYLPSFSLVKWQLVNRIKTWLNLHFFDKRSGRPETCTSYDKIIQINNGVMKDRRLKIRDCKYSVDGVHSILHEGLGMKKLFMRRMPHFNRFPETLLNKYFSTVIGFL